MLKIGGMKAAALNLRHVRALAAAVKAGSISGAAAAIGLTQPAVTQAIAKLEALTGTGLLERSPAGVTPTDGGILLAARAEAAMTALAEAFRPYRKGGTGGRPGADQDISMAQLQAFLALADGGSYVAGAASSGLTQPSLHRAVGDLERLCGIALVERQGRGVGLTGPGLRLARAFRIAVAELEAALDELAVLAGRDQGAMRIAAAGSAFHRLLPITCVRFLAAHPPVRMEMEEARLPAAAAALRDGRIDVLLAFDGSEGLTDGIAAEPLLDIPLHITGRSGHPLASVTAAGLVRLASFGWALPAGGAEERRAWDAMFLNGGLFPPPVNVACADPPALLQLVAATDLLTLASGEMLAGCPSALITIGDPVATRRLLLCTRTGWYPTPAQAAFLDELRDQAAALASF